MHPAPYFHRRGNKSLCQNLYIDIFCVLVSLVPSIDQCLGEKRTLYGKILPTTTSWANSLVNSILDKRGEKGKNQLIDWISKYCMFNLVIDFWKHTELSESVIDFHLLYNQSPITLRQTRSIINRKKPMCLIDRMGDWLNMQFNQQIWIW